MAVLLAEPDLQVSLLLLGWLGSGAGLSGRAVLETHYEDGARVPLCGSFRALPPQWQHNNNNNNDTKQ